MSILKLANAGDEATLEISNVEVVQGQYGEQVKFTSGDNILFLPKDSAVRQLERLGLVLADAVDETLIFSRTPNAKPKASPYWNIAVAGNGKTAPKPNPAKTPVPAHSNVPDKDLPPFLQNATAEDNAELAAKVGVDLAGIQNTLALYQGIAEWASRELPPIFAKGKDAVGMTPESLAACANTIFINTAGKK